MPLNPPSAIDRRGLTPLANANGSFDSEFPNGDKPEPVGITLSGSGFGAGPDIAIFDPTIGQNGELVDLNGAVVGAWTGYNDKTAGAVEDTRYFEHLGRTWTTGRSLSSIGSNVKDLTGMRYEHPTKFNKFRMSYRVAIPDGYKMPGATATNSKTGADVGSLWKLDWMSNREYGYAGENDMVMPTMNNGGFTVTGNGVRPYSATGQGSNGTIPFQFSMFDPSSAKTNFFSYYCGGDESVDGAADSTIQTIQSNDATVDIREYVNNCDPFRPLSGSIPENSLDTFLCNGWMGNVGAGDNLGNYINVLPLFTDFWLAVGENAGAVVISHDAPTVSGSKNIAQIPHQSWSDTEIFLSNVRPWEELGYYSVYSQDPADTRNLILHENVSVS